MGRHADAAWEPLRAPVFVSQSTGRAGVTMTPLSQMPVPTVKEELSPPSSPTRSPPPVRTTQGHHLDEYQWDHFDVDSVSVKMEAEPTDVNPIKRTPLRLCTGLPTLDAYASSWHHGGAYARWNEDADVPSGSQYGFPVGSALEVVGPPGVGKTTLAMQLAVSERWHHVQHTMLAYMDDVGPPSSLQCADHLSATLCEALDDEVEPWCAQVVMVDTEGSMLLSRLLQLTRAALRADAVALMRRFAAAAGLQVPSSEDDVLMQCAERAVLRGIHLVRATTLSELLAFVGTAASTVLKVPGLPPRTSLLIIDTLSCFTYSHALPPHASRDQWRAREKAVEQLVRGLTILRDSQLPAAERLTVVVTLQMSTRRGGAEGGEPALVPSLTQAPTSTMRLAHNTGAEWAPSILGRSAWRFLLSYTDLGAARYVSACLTQLVLCRVASRPRRGRRGARIDRPPLDRCAPGALPRLTQADGVSEL